LLLVGAFAKNSTLWTLDKTLIIGMTLVSGPNRLNPSIEGAIEPEQRQTRAALLSESNYHGVSDISL